MDAVTCAEISLLLLYPRIKGLGLTQYQFVNHVNVPITYMTLLALAPVLSVIVPSEPTLMEASDNVEAVHAPVSLAVTD